MNEARPHSSMILYSTVCVFIAVYTMDQTCKSLIMKNPFFIACQRKEDSCLSYSYTCFSIFVEIISCAIDLMYEQPLYCGTNRPVQPIGTEQRRHSRVVLLVIGRSTGSLTVLSSTDKNTMKGLMGNGRLLWLSLTIYLSDNEEVTQSRPDDGEATRDQGVRSQKEGETSITMYYTRLSYGKMSVNTVMCIPRRGLPVLCVQTMSCIHACAQVVDNSTL